MDNKKKQHYVPKFLLRQFSELQSKKGIHLLNLKTNKIFLNSSLKGQCQKEYFYGKDQKLENRFMELEAISSQIIYRISKNPTDIQSLSTEEKYKLFEFMVLQFQRTQGAVNQTNEMFDTLLNNIFDLEKEHAENREKFGIKNTLHFNLKLATEILPYVFDLKIAILESKDTEFILSDNPLFTINPFLKHKNWHGSGLGIGCVGVILVLPITPFQCLILYDSDIYRLNKEYLHQITKTDADRINNHSIYYAAENIYFYSEDTGKYIQNLNFISSEKDKKIFRLQEHLEVKTNETKKKSSLLIISKKNDKLNSILYSIPFSNQALELPLSLSLDFSRPYVKKIKKEKITSHNSN